MIYGCEKIAGLTMRIASPVSTPSPLSEASSATPRHALWPCAGEKNDLRHLRPSPVEPSTIAKPAASATFRAATHASIWISRSAACTAAAAAP